MHSLLLALALSFFSADALALPGQVLIIRHAEKPENDAEIHLSPVGRRRAEALVAFFRQHASVTEFGPPVAIFAAAPRHEDGSLRSIETVTPLARAMGINVDDSYTARDFKDLADHVLDKKKYEGRTVLISWPRDEIPKLAKHLGVRPAPDNWDKGTFDRVWKITYPRKNSAHFVDLPQGVLPGDSR